MTEIILYSFLSVFLISFISFVGALFFLIKKEVFPKILLYFVSFSIGAMLGAAFFHLIPEALELEANTLFYVLFGFLFSFVLEKFIKWRHCHNPEHLKKDIHPFAYINLIGDAVHNFIDGIIIAASYLVSIPLGISTTFAVMMHEIPQEFGDFAVLLHGGFTKKKALFLNFLTALSAVLGVILTLFIGPENTQFTSILIAFAAGNFIYIAASDLIPELHKENRISKSLLQFFFILLGIIIMVNV